MQASCSASADAPSASEDAPSASEDAPFIARASLLDKSDALVAFRDARFQNLKWETGTRRMVSKFVYPRAGNRFDTSLPNPNLRRLRESGSSVNSKIRGAFTDLVPPC